MKEAKVIIRISEEQEPGVCPHCDGDGEVLNEWDEDDFEEYLNGCYDSVEICGYEMEQGTILRECDPIAFRQAMFEAEEFEECEECGGTGEVEE